MMVKSVGLKYVVHFLYIHYEAFQAQQQTLWDSTVDMNCVTSHPLPLKPEYNFNNRCNTVIMAQYSV